MGVKTIPTNANPAYKVLIDFLRHLGTAKLDAAFGLTALFFLYAVRSFFQWLPTRYPKTARVAFFAAVIRSAFVIIVLTIASRIWLGSYNPKKYPISILLTVPRGFRHLGQPNLDPKLIADMGSELPVSVIVLLLEHIAIAKSFGRLNNYKINPNQELIAIGVTNFVGPCFGAYAATGSFSRTAIKSKAGVRSPAAGWATGIVVLIAIYALTGVFYWIPNAALSAVIIHAVFDLIASPRTLYKFWLVNPLEFFIWLAAVLVTVFTTVENGVYTSVGASLALLLVRIARPRGRWLGTVRVSHGDGTNSVTDGSKHRQVFVPLDDKDGLRDPSIHVQPPPAGVLIYRFEESYLYPNASHLADLLIERAKSETRPGRAARYSRAGDRPWNDPGPINPAFRKVFGRLARKSASQIKAQIQAENAIVDDPRPLLKAFVFDFSSVSNVDTTSIQTLVDVRRAVEQYADRTIEFHFANILSPWIRRALLAGGFGTGPATRHITEVAPVVHQRDALPVYEARARQQAEDERRRAAVERVLQARDAAIAKKDESTLKPDQEEDIEKAISSGSEESQGSTEGSSKDASLFGDTRNVTTTSHVVEEGNSDDADDDDVSVHVPIIWANDLTPLFHLDLASAVEAASAP